MKANNSSVLSTGRGEGVGWSPHSSERPSGRASTTWRSSARVRSASRSRSSFAWTDALLESLLAFKRAGADAILTYAALEIAEHLRSSYATTARG